MIRVLPVYSDLQQSLSMVELWLEQNKLISTSQFCLFSIVIDYAH